MSVIKYFFSFVLYKQILLHYGYFLFIGVQFLNICLCASVLQKKIKRSRQDSLYLAYDSFYKCVCIFRSDRNICQGILHKNIYKDILAEKMYFKYHSFIRVKNDKEKVFLFLFFTQNTMSILVCPLILKQCVQLSKEMFKI